MYTLPTYAVDVTTKACEGISDSAVCQDSKPDQTSNPLFGTDGILTTAASLLSFLVALIAVIVLIIAGLRFVINGANPQAITASRNTVFFAVVGIVVAAVAQVIVKFVLIKL